MSDRPSSISNLPAPNVSGRPDPEPNLTAAGSNRNSNTRPRSESDFSRRLVPTPNAPLGKKIAEELHQRFPKRSSEKLTVVADLFTKLTATDQPADLIEKKIKDKRQQIDKLVGQIKEKRSALVKTYSTEAPSFSGKPSPEVETSIKEFGKKLRGLIDDDAFEFKKTVDLFKGLQNKAYKKGHNFGSKGIISQLYDCFDKKSVKQALDDKDIGEKFEKLSKLAEAKEKDHKDPQADSWKIIHDRVKPFVRFLKLRDAFGTLQKALEAGETPSKALADIERGLQETFASLSIQNVVSEKIPYGVEFVGGFAELGKSLSKLRCEINLAELKQSLASFPEASPKPRNLFDELLEDFSDQNVETTIKGLEDLKATLSAEGIDTGKSENKIDELTDNVRLMSLNHKVAECERQRITLNGEYLQALRPRTKVDLDKFRTLTERFPQTNETILAVALASNPNIDIEELVALRNLFPEKSIEDLANLLDSVGLSAIQSFKQHLPDVKFFEMQQLLLEYPKLNAANAAALQKHLSKESLSNIAEALKRCPELDPGTAAQFRRRFPKESLSVIAEALNINRDLVLDRAAQFRHRFPNESLSVIAEALNINRDLVLDRAAQFRHHFPGESLTEIASALKVVPELELDMVAQFRHHFPHTELYTIAFVLFQFRGIDIDKAAKIKESFPDEDLCEIARALTKFPRLQIDIAAEAKESFSRESLFEIAKALTEFPKLQVDKAAEIKESFSRESLFEIAKALTEFPKLQIDKAAEIKESFSRESLFEIAKVLTEYPKLQIGKAARLYGKVSEPLWIVAKALDHYSDVDINKVAKFGELSRTHGSRNTCYGVVRVLKEFPNLEADSVAKIKDHLPDMRLAKLCEVAVLKETFPLEPLEKIIDVLSQQLTRVHIDKIIDLEALIQSKNLLTVAKAVWDHPEVDVKDIAALKTAT